MSLILGQLPGFLAVYRTAFVEYIEKFYIKADGTVRCWCLVSVKETRQIATKASDDSQACTTPASAPQQPTDSRVILV